MPTEHEPDSDSRTLAEDEADYERLLTFLKESRAFDFTGYKRPSLIRRIKHRMHEVSVSSVDEYTDRLQLQPDEFTSLFNTILINVTGFFRDPEAWDYLREQILPALLADIEGAPLRCGVPCRPRCGRRTSPGPRLPPPARCASR